MRGKKGQCGRKMKMQFVKRLGGRRGGRVKRRGECGEASRRLDARRRLLASMPGGASMPAAGAAASLE